MINSELDSHRLKGNYRGRSNNVLIHKSGNKVSYIIINTANNGVNSR